MNLDEKRISEAWAYKVQSEKVEQCVQGRNLQTDESDGDSVGSTFFWGQSLFRLIMWAAGLKGRCV